jgi:hypothetical protein
LKVFFDKDVPRKLARFLPQHEIQTVVKTGSGNEVLAPRGLSALRLRRPLYNQGMPALEQYLKEAANLAQAVVNDWGMNVNAGNGPALSAEFLALNEHACCYLEARSLADSHRKFSGLTDEDAAREAATRLAFAQAYKAYWERVSQPKE